MLAAFLGGEMGRAKLGLEERGFFAALLGGERGRATFALEGRKTRLRGSEVAFLLAAGTEDPEGERGTAFVQGLG